MGGMCSCGEGPGRHAECGSMESPTLGWFSQYRRRRRRQGSSSHDKEKGGERRKCHVLLLLLLMVAECADLCGGDKVLDTVSVRISCHFVCGYHLRFHCIQ